MNDTYSVIIDRDDLAEAVETIHEQSLSVIAVIPNRDNVILLVTSLEDAAYLKIAFTRTPETLHA